MRQYNFPLLLKGHLSWTMNIIECAFSIRVLLNYRGYRSRPHLSTCQSIDSKSILTNRNSGFFKPSLTLAKQLLIIITSERQRDSPLVYVYMYSWEIQTFFEFKTVSMRSWLADHHPRYAMFYVTWKCTWKSFLIVHRFMITLLSNKF